MVARLLERRRVGRRVDALYGRSGAIAAVFVRWRVCLDVWHGGFIVCDPDAAGVLAQIIDRSPTRQLNATARDASGVLPHITRVTRVYESPWVVVAPTLVAELPELLRETRAPQDAELASRADLKGLYRIYDSYEVDPFPTRLQLRRYLKRMVLANAVVVVRAEDTIVAAIVFTGATHRFAVCNYLTVAPEHRRGGLAWALGLRAVEILRDRSLGAVGEIGPTSPMKKSELVPAHIDPETMLQIQLRVPPRVRGQERARHLLRRVGGVRRRRSPEHLDRAAFDARNPG